MQSFRSFRVIAAVLALTASFFVAASASATGICVWRPSVDCDWDVPDDPIMKDGWYNLELEHDKFNAMFEIRDDLVTDFMFNDPSLTVFDFKLEADEQWDWRTWTMDAGLEGEVSGQKGDRRLVLAFDADGTYWGQIGTREKEGKYWIKPKEKHEDPIPEPSAALLFAVGALITRRTIKLRSR